eukprot:2146697-Rhodomonas_salina.1
MPEPEMPYPIRDVRTKRQGPRRKHARSAHTPSQHQMIGVSICAMSGLGINIGLCTHAMSVLSLAEYTHP